MMKRNNVSNIKPDKDGNYQMKVNKNEGLLYNPKGLKPTKLDPSRIKKEIEKITKHFWTNCNIGKDCGGCKIDKKEQNVQLLELCSSVCDDVIYKLTDLLEHGDFCGHCRGNALDIADYFNKRGRFKETKTKKEKVV